MSLTEWKPEVQCPQDDAPLNEDTANAFRKYIRKLEIELLVTPKNAMLSMRDEMISDNVGLLSQKDREIARLKAEVEDLSKMVEHAALTGVVKLGSMPLPEPGQMFVIDKAEWKNKIITTLGFAEKEFYMQFTPERRLVRLVTDTDLKKAVQDRAIDMPPV